MQLRLRTRLNVSLQQFSLQLMDAADDGLVTGIEASQYGGKFHHLSESLVARAAQCREAVSDALKLRVKSCHVVTDGQLP